MASLNARKKALVIQYCRELEKLGDWKTMSVTNEAGETIGVLIGDEEFFADMTEPVEG